MSDEVRIWCDYCEAVIAAPENEMGEKLDAAGWTVVDDFGDFACPQCRKGNQSGLLGRHHTAGRRRHGWAVSDD